MDGIGGTLLERNNSPGVLSNRRLHLLYSIDNSRQCLCNTAAEIALRTLSAFRIQTEYEREMASIVDSRPGGV
jgi:hypothetical protein